MKEAEALNREFETAGEAWARSVKKQREEVKALLASAGLKNADQLITLQRQKAKLEKDLSESARKLETRSELISKRETAIAALDSARREISRLTGDAVHELNSETGPRVRLVHQGLVGDTTRPVSS